MDTSFDTVVLAVGPRDDDRLDALARTVLQVAVPTGATVVLTHVFTGDQFKEAAAELDYARPSQADVDAVLERHASVRALEERLDEYGVDHVVRGVVGDVADGVVRIAEETDADRVVVSGRARSPAGKAVFGSTAQQVLLGAPCPVTYVKPEARTDAG